MSKSSYWQVRGPLADYAEGFRAELARLGYTQLTAAGVTTIVSAAGRRAGLRLMAAHRLRRPAGDWDAVRRWVVERDWPSAAAPSLSEDRTRRSTATRRDSWPTPSQSE